MNWMDPTLSLSLEAGLRAAQLQLQRMPRRDLIARAEYFMSAAATSHHLLSQAMRRIAELELQAASQPSHAGQVELIPDNRLSRPRWPWNRQG
jgi:hypothetical protein